MGPQRRVIHHTTMQSALVHPLSLSLQVFFSSSSLSDTSSFFLSFHPPFIHSFVCFLHPSITVSLPVNPPLSLSFSLALVFRFHRLLWRHPSFSSLHFFPPSVFTFCCLKGKKIILLFSFFFNLLVEEEGMERRRRDGDSCQEEGWME